MVGVWRSRAGVGQVGVWEREEGYTKKENESGGEGGESRKLVGEIPEVKWSPMYRYNFSCAVVVVLSDYLCV